MQFNKSCASECQSYLDIYHLWVLLLSHLKYLALGTPNCILKKSLFLVLFWEIRFPDNALHVNWLSKADGLLILCVTLARGKCGIGKIWTAIYSGWQGRKPKALISALGVSFKPWQNDNKNYLSLRIAIKDKTMANKSSQNPFSRRLIR